MLDEVIWEIHATPNEMITFQTKSNSPENYIMELWLSWSKLLSKKIISLILNNVAICYNYTKN